MKEVESPDSCRPPSLLLRLSFSLAKGFWPQEDREDWCRTLLRDPAGPAARAHSFLSMLDALSPYGPRVDADRNLKVERGQAWESARAAAPLVGCGPRLRPASPGHFETQAVPTLPVVSRDGSLTLTKILTEL